MGEIFEVAVDIARLEAAPHRIRKIMGDAGHALQRPARIAVPARLTGEGVAVELSRRPGVGTEGADNGQELRGRSGIVLLIKAGQHDIGVRRWFPAERGSKHHPVVGHMLHISIGVARTTNRAHRQRIRQSEVDITEHFLAIEAAINRAQFAARYEIGTFRYKVDETADRTLPEQHRRRATHDLNALEIIRIGSDARII